MELRVLRSVIGGGCVMAIVVKLSSWSSCRCESDSIVCSARFCCIFQLNSN